MELETVHIEKKIIPAIIAKTQEELTQNIMKVIEFSDRIQLDIMDHEFVENTSLFFDFSLPKIPCHYEAHLMVKNPKEWIEQNINKVDTILIHYESDGDFQEIISYVKQKQKKVGFVVNPETPIAALENIVDQIDQVLIMTVNPGFYGSPFLPEMTEKIKTLRRMKPSLNIEVDGGITPDTIGLVNSAGANLFVSGSYIVKADKPDISIKALQELVEI